MTSIAEEPEAAQAEAASEQPKGTKKARVRAQRAQWREKSPCRPGREQDGQSAGLAETGGRGHRQGTAQGDGLAAAFPARVPVGYHRQEDRADGQVHEG